MMSSSSSSNNDDDNSLLMTTQETGASSSDDDDALMLAVCEATVLTAQAGHALVENCYERLFQPMIYEPSSRGGSRKGKAKNKERNFVAAYNSLRRDYFRGDNSVYDEVDFERRFRSPRPIFIKIYEACLHTRPFIITQDGLGKDGIHPLARVVACLRFLSLGTCLDAQDEFLRIAQSTTHASVRVFVRIIKSKFGGDYLNRNPTDHEKKRILSFNKNRGFPGLFASWDCTHFKWDKCPVEDHGAFKSRKGPKTIILEAVVDFNLRIWFSNFGCPGSMNDINVLDKSTIIQAIVTSQFDLKTTPYLINGNYRDYMYFLVDGIYPKYAIFQSTGNKEGTEAEKLFSMQQEGARKDVERVFAVLEGKFKFLKNPFQGHDIGYITEIVESCIIIHNMIVENNVSNPNNNDDDEELDMDLEINNIITIFDKSINATDAQKVHAIEINMECEDRNSDLKEDLIEDMFYNVNSIDVYEDNQLFEY